jgi:glycosyltransferase involved in cell wall biosynthesis
MFASHVPAARRGVIWNGLDLSRADAIRKSTTRESARRHLGLPRDVKILVCVGSVCQRKGQHVLVEAIGRMAARSKAPVCVLVGARPSPYLEGLERRVGALGLEGLVRIVPETEDPFLYYRAADLFVCPSFEESLPRVVLEAMAFALPIVATNVYGIPEMIDERSGWLVPPGDPDALAAAIEAVIDDPDAARQVGGRARERAENDFRIETMGQRYVDILRGLAGSGVAYGEAS